MVSLRMKRVWQLELPFGYFKALRQGKKEGCSCVRNSRDMKLKRKRQYHYNEIIFLKMKWNSQDLLYRATFCPAQSQEVRKGMDLKKSFIL